MSTTRLQNDFQNLKFRSTSVKTVLGLRCCKNSAENTYFPSFCLTDCSVTAKPSTWVTVHLWCASRSGGWFTILNSLFSRMCLMSSLDTSSNWIPKKRVTVYKNNLLIKDSKQQQLYFAIYPALSLATSSFTFVLLIPTQELNTAFMNKDFVETAHPYLN